jgi:hypothetical protein
VTWHDDVAPLPESVQVADGLKVPAPLLVNVTELVGVVGLKAVSLTVTAHVVATVAAVEPGLHVTEVVVV